MYNEIRFSFLFDLWEKLRDGISERGERENDRVAVGKERIRKDTGTSEGIKIKGR